MPELTLQIYLLCVAAALTHVLYLRDSIADTYGGLLFWVFIACIPYLNVIFMTLYWIAEGWIRLNIEGWLNTPLRRPKC